MCEESQYEWREVRIEFKGGEVRWEFMGARSRGFLHVIHTAIGVIAVPLEVLSVAML